MVQELSPNLHGDHGIALAPDQERWRVDSRELRPDVSRHELLARLEDRQRSCAPAISDQDGQEAERRGPQGAEQADQVAQIAGTKRKYRGIDQDQPHGSLRKVGSQTGGDEPAHRVADDVGLPDADLVYPPREVACRFGEDEGVRAAAFAEADEVDAVDPEVLARCPDVFRPPADRS